VSRPLVAPAGTLVTILVAVSDTMVADVPWRATRVAPARFCPVMTTVAPTFPDLGATLPICGVTAVVIRPIALSPSVDHVAPSGPPVMPAPLPE
jgi:hypothetical protein